MRDPASKGSISRSMIPRILNALLWLVFCSMSGTGLLLAFRLPPGSRGGQGLSAAGLSRHEWGDIHTWLSYAFLALILTHLALHWRWFWQVAARRKAWPLLAGLGAGILLLLLLALQPVKHGGRHKQGGTGRNSCAPPASLRIASMPGGAVLVSGA